MKEWKMPAHSKELKSWNATLPHRISRLGRLLWLCSLMCLAIQRFFSRNISHFGKCLWIRIGRVEHWLRFFIRTSGALVMRKSKPKWEKKQCANKKRDNNVGINQHAANKSNSLTKSVISSTDTTIEKKKPNKPPQESEQDEKHWQKVKTTKLLRTECGKKRTTHTSCRGNS